MNTNLPDDMRLWPSDPYELLGVSPTSDSRSLRQAYTLLIRRFKPEHAPDQFRRVREAYETALRRLEFRERFANFEAQRAVVDPAETDPAVGDPTATDLDAVGDASSDVDGRSASVEEPDSDSPAEPAPAVKPQRQLAPKSFAEQLEELWEQVCAGDTAQVERAYRQICQLQPEHSSDEAIYIRLYWLLRLEPELDRGQTATDWMFKGLAHCSPAWMLRELCREQVDRDPQLAFRAEFESLLATETLDASTVEVLLAARWRAAVQLDREQAIGDDLNAFRAYWSQRDEALWGRLLVRAMECLIWSDVEPVRLAAEVDAMPHFQVNLTGELDQLDYLRQIAAEYRTLCRSKSIPNSTLERLLSVWQQPHHEANRILLDLAGELVVQPPGDVLRFFDHVQSHCPTLLVGMHGRFCFRDYDERTAEEPRDPKRLEEAIGDFLGEHPGPAYPALRPRLLAFCLREAIDPANLGAIIAPVPLLCFRRGQNLSESISQDIALKCAYAMHARMWV